MSQKPPTNKRAFPWDEDQRTTTTTKKSKVESNQLYSVTASGAGPSSPTKTPRSKKATAEKRGARIRTRCPQNIMDRVERVMSQRFYMIDRRRNGDEVREEFSVLGSTGNCYTVTIGHQPSCNCPDALRGNHCKHILFIFLKVLQVPQGSAHWYQKALLTDELHAIFNSSPTTPGSAMDHRVSDAYARATGQTPSTSSPKKDSDSKRRIPGPDDDCPVCYEGMHGAKEDSLAFCESCGNALHADCLRQWAKSSGGSGKELTCVFCRAPWAWGDKGKGGGAAGSSEGYLNLAGAVPGIATERDESTYHRPYSYLDDVDEETAFTVGYGQPRRRGYGGYRRRW